MALNSAGANFKWYQHNTHRPIQWRMLRIVLSAVNQFTGFFCWSSTHWLPPLSFCGPYIDAHTFSIDCSHTPLVNTPPESSLCYTLLFFCLTFILSMIDCLPNIQKWIRLHRQASLPCRDRLKIIATIEKVNRNMMLFLSTTWICPYPPPISLIHHYQSSEYIGPRSPLVEISSQTSSNLYDLWCCLI